MKNNFKKGLIVFLTFALVFSFVGCAQQVEEENLGGQEQNNEENEETALNPENKVPKIEFWIFSQTKDPIRYEAGLMIAEAWKDLGFEVDAQVLEWATMSAEGFKGHRHDAFIVQWGGKPERVDPYHWLYVMHHSETAKEGGYNIAGYINPKYDELAEQFAFNNDPQARQEAAHEMQEMLTRDVPQPSMFKRKLTQSYNGAKFENITPGIGEGLYSFWNFVNITPTGEDKILNFGAVTDIQLLNPLTTKKGQDQYMLKLIYDPLLRIDENGEIVNWIASSYESVDDTTIEVTIRDDVYFHDGEPLTAEDVKFTFDFAMETQAPYYYSQIKALESVEIVEENKLVFKLSKPFAPFISNGFTMCGILPKHIWEKEYKEKGAEAVLQWENVPAIGSGPFKFDYWRVNEEFALEANKEHFYAPQIDGILRIPYTNDYGVIQGQIANEVDMNGANLLPMDLEEIAKNVDIETVEIPDLGSYIMHFNMRNQPFNDVYARRALTMAIPREAIIEVVMGGQGFKAFNPVAAENTFWYNGDTEELDFDLEKAREELKEAGYLWDEDGKLYYSDDFEATSFLSE